MVGRSFYNIGFFILTVACSPEHNIATKIYRPHLKGLPVNYQTLKNEILGPRCLQCHVKESGSSARDLPFFPYEVLLAETEKKWQAPGANSRIIRAVTRTDKHRMPPLEEEGLSEEEVTFLMDWIDLGKPEF